LIVGFDESLPPQVAVRVPFCVLGTQLEEDFCCCQSKTSRENLDDYLLRQGLKPLKFKWLPDGCLKFVGKRLKHNGVKSLALVLPYTILAGEGEGYHRSVVGHLAYLRALRQSVAGLQISFIDTKWNSTASRNSIFTQFEHGAMVQGIRDDGWDVHRANHMDTGTWELVDEEDGESDKD